MSMKILQIVPCLGVNSGGPSRSVFELTRGLRERGVIAEIATQNYLTNPNLFDEEWIDALPVNKVKPFEYNAEFKALLSGKIMQEKFQLFHINSIYSYPTFIASYLANIKCVPYIIAPRGSLYPNVIESSSKWKKRIFNSLFLKKQLNNASAVHTTCVEEMEVIRKMGINAPIAIIPNSIQLPKERLEIESPDKIRVCYLGRINPKKNILGLLKAWFQSGMSCNSSAELVIIGAAQLDKEKTYLEELHNLESELEIKNIRWVGAKEGKEKEVLLRSCSYLIMPSFSENFGMVVPEALQYGIPVVASKGTPWQILELNHCGWWTDIDTESLANTIKLVGSISIEERLKMGLRAQELVYEKFSTENVCKMQIELYRWILEGGEKPSFVYIKE